LQWRCIANRSPARVLQIRQLPESQFLPRLDKAIAEMGLTFEDSDRSDDKTNEPRQLILSLTGL
jgi:hypothetical protein